MIEARDGGRHSFLLPSFPPFLLGSMGLSDDHHYIVTKAFLCKLKTVSPLGRCNTMVAVVSKMVVLMIITGRKISRQRCGERRED